ncbi:protein of unknown function [Serratia sp. Tan611]|nr:protein of unknown function [Serratia sp. Tan611]
MMFITMKKEPVMFAIATKTIIPAVLSCRLVIVAGRVTS